MTVVECSEDGLEGLAVEILPGNLVRLRPVQLNGALEWVSSSGSAQILTPARAIDLALALMVAAQ